MTDATPPNPSDYTYEPWSPLRAAPGITLGDGSMFRAHTVSFARTFHAARITGMVLLYDLFTHARDQTPLNYG